MAKNNLIILHFLIKKHKPITAKALNLAVIPESTQEQRDVSARSADLGAIEPTLSRDG